MKCAIVYCKRVIIHFGRTQDKINKLIELFKSRNDNTLFNLTYINTSRNLYFVAVKTIAISYHSQFLDEVGDSIHMVLQTAKLYFRIYHIAV